MAQTQCLHVQGVGEEAVKVVATLENVRRFFGFINAPVSVLRVYSCVCVCLCCVCAFVCCVCVYVSNRLACVCRSCVAML